MAKRRSQRSADFKFCLALEAAKGQHTINELAGQHGVHPNQISQWKRQLLDHGPDVFNGQTLARQQKTQQSREIQLYEQIGRLQMELEWLKKNLPFSLERRQALIEVDHPQLSIRRPCELIGLHRGTFYYQLAGETPLNLELMRLIDEAYTCHPFYKVVRR